jgi:hypothetical protein
MAEAFDLADLVHGSRDGVDQVVDGAAAAHHGLADVHQFRRAGAEDVHAEQRVCLNQFSRAVDIRRHATRQYERPASFG